MNISKTMTNLSLSLILSIIILSTSFSAHANGMIGNSASGHVNGSIIQIARNHSTNEIHIGSIVGKHGQTIRNAHVRGTVNGNIYIESNGSDVRLNVGSLITR